VKVVDGNVLLYSINADDSHYKLARRWLRDALRGTEPLGFSWVVLLAFVRVATSPAFESPLTVAQAFDFVESWLARPVAVIVDPTKRHLAVWRGLIEQSGTAGNLTTDAHIAALALEHGAEVVTFDRDFGRFGVRHMIPA